MPNSTLIKFLDAVKEEMIKRQDKNAVSEMAKKSMAYIKLAKEIDTRELDMAIEAVIDRTSKKLYDTLDYNNLRTAVTDIKFQEYRSGIVRRYSEEEEIASMIMRMGFSYPIISKKFKSVLGDEYANVINKMMKEIDGEYKEKYTKRRFV